MPMIKTDKVNHIVRSYQSRCEFEDKRKKKTEKHFVFTNK